MAVGYWLSHSEKLIACNFDYDYDYDFNFDFDYCPSNLLTS